MDVISDPKNYIADFVGFKAVYFGRKFWKKCPKRGGEGGGLRQSKKFHYKFTHTYEFSGKGRNVIFWIRNFSKKTSIFGETVVP